MRTVHSDLGLVGRLPLTVRLGLGLVVHLPFDHAARVCIRVCRANSASGGRPRHLPVSAKIVAQAASGHS